MALRGALSGVGVAMWLPVLDAMTDDHGEAFAQGAPLPTTFGVFFWANGVHVPDWTPGGLPGGEWTLPPNLAAFEAVKSRLTLVTGLDMLDGGFGGHGTGIRYVASGGNKTTVTSASAINYGLDAEDPNNYEAWEKQHSSQTFPTIDQLVASHLETVAPSPFRSLETGILPVKQTAALGTLSAGFSHTGPYGVLPVERDPVALYNRLFSIAGEDPTSNASKILVEMQRSSLDAVLDDLNRLKTQVGAVDAARIDRHTEGIRAIEKRLGAFMPGASCVPTKPGAVAVEDYTKVEERSQVINRLLAAALGCNLTRVYSHLWSSLRDENAYPMLGINGEHHALTHSDKASDHVAHSTIERYIMGNFADLAIAMNETPMGAGTVLDYTMSLGVTDVGDPFTHYHTNYHVPIIGGAGGRLKGNQYVKFTPGAGGDGRKLTELYLTALQTMGLPLQQFGTWDPTSRTISEILA